MAELFELSMPWWEFVLRAVAVYVVLMVLIRMSGKRAMGQFTPFDVLLICCSATRCRTRCTATTTRSPAALLLAGDADRAELRRGVLDVAQPAAPNA